MAGGKSRSRGRHNAPKIVITDDTYVNWKSLGLLRKYMTRFGDIKPRKYTGLSVSMQKKMRQAIIRARELGVAPYLK